MLRSSANWSCRWCGATRSWRFSGWGSKPADYTEQDLETVSIFADLAWEIAERKRAEVRLALVDFALNNVHEAAYLIDEHGCFHYVNYESCRSLGYHCNELLALTVADVDPDRPLLRWPDHWRDLKELGSLNFEGRHRKKDGHIFPVEINANYFEYDGRSYNLALVRDITERKRAEVLLRKREEEFRTLAENLPDNIIRYDRQCRKTYVNSNLLRLYGVDLSLVLGKTPEELHPEGLTRKDEFYDKLRRVMETGEPDEIEVSVSYPSGEFQTHNVRFVAERDKQGNVVGAIAIGRDITERKRAEELLSETLDALRKSESRYRDLINVLPVGVFEADADAKLIFMNDRGMEMIGLRWEEGDGRGWETVIHPDDRDSMLAGVERLYKTGKPFMMDYRQNRPDGTTNWVLTHIIRRIDTGGAIGSSIDITERKRAVQLLQ